MSNLQRVAAVLVALAPFAALGLSAATADDRTIDFATKPGGEQVFRVDAAFEVSGNLKVRAADKIQSLPTAATAKLTYDERLLLDEADPLAMRQSVRAYRSAEAKIQVDRQIYEPRLGEPRRVVVARETDAQVEMFSPAGALTFDELELIQIPANSLLVERLLPGKTVAVGEQWSHDATLVSALLNLDAVSRSDVTSKLAELDENSARIELAGTVSGALGGVATEIELAGRYQYDRTAGRITWLALLVKEQRAIGHVEPGVEMTARVQMTIAPVAVPDELSVEQISKLDLAGGPEVLRVAFEGPGYRFEHDRRWHVMTDNGDALSMRMVERGELVAQCNVTAVPLLSAEQRPTLEQFQADIRRALGEYFGQFTRASESRNSLGYVIYRIEAVGRVEEIDITWFYYLVQSPDAGQVVFAFTCEQPMLERLAEEDRTMVSTLRFIAPASAAANSDARR